MKQKSYNDITSQMKRMRKLNKARHPDCKNRVEEIIKAGMNARIKRKISIFTKPEERNDKK